MAGRAAKGHTCSAAVPPAAGSKTFEEIESHGAVTFSVLKIVL